MGFDKIFFEMHVTCQKFSKSEYENYVEQSNMYKFEPKKIYICTREFCADTHGYMNKKMKTYTNKIIKFGKQD